MKLLRLLGCLVAVGLFFEMPTTLFAARGGSSNVRQGGGGGGRSFTPARSFSTARSHVRSAPVRSSVPRSSFSRQSNPVRSSVSSRSSVSARSRVVRPVTSGKTASLRSSSRAKTTVASKANAKTTTATKAKAATTVTKATTVKAANKAATVTRATAAKKAKTTTTTTTTTTAAGGATTTTTTKTVTRTVPGIGRGHWRWAHPHHGYWGRRHFFSSFGFWYYPGWGFWYYPSYGCWYYPWARCWYFHDWGYWYYPGLHFSVYLASVPDRVVFVDNDSDDDLYYAVYSRRQIGDVYYMYRVDEPMVIDRRRSVKVHLPRDKEKEYVVLAEKDEKQLPQRMHQDSAGKVQTVEATKKDAGVEPVDYEKIKVEGLSKADKRKLKKIKRDVNKKQKKLKKAAKNIEDIKNPEKEVVADGAAEKTDKARNEEFDEIGVLAD